MRKLLAALAISTVLAAGLAWPAAVGRAEESAPELAIEGLETLMKALQVMIAAIPQFGAPYIDEQGNIVIPRIDGPGADEGGADPDAEEPIETGEDEAAT